MITPRENLLRVLRHEAPEWIPIAGFVDRYNRPSPDGTDPALEEAMKRDGPTRGFSRYLGLDIMDWCGCGMAPWDPADGANVGIEKREEGEDTITIFHTPLGDIGERVRHSPDSGLSYRVEHLIKSADDLPILASIFEGARHEIPPDSAAALARRKEAIGDDGIITIPLAGTPLGMFIRIYAGVETTAYLCADAPDALRDCFSVMEESYVRQFRLAASTSADALIGMDDTSTTTLSPAMFETFCMDYTDHVADAVHEAGKLYFHHSCGLIRNLVGLYRETRMDAVHGLTVPPLGDVTVREAKEKLGPNIAIIAGLTQLLSRMDDWDAAKAGVREMFEGAAPGDNLLLVLSSNPVNTLAEIQRLLEECRKCQHTFSG